MATKSKSGDLSTVAILTKKPGGESAAAPAVAAPALAPSHQAVGRVRAMTVKVDEARYQALKLAGLRLGRTSQDIFLEALDAWLKRHA